MIFILFINNMQLNSFWVQFFTKRNTLYVSCFTFSGIILDPQACMNTLLSAALQQGFPLLSNNYVIKHIL